LNVLDLFSGIGGFSIGLERAGMRTVAFCEIEPFCRAVLAKHWPHVPCYDDIRTLTAARLAADGIISINPNANGSGFQVEGSEQQAAGPEQFRAMGIDVICGGFPCQDISVAGRGAGIEGSRSGLWSEYARIIGELRPRYVIVENVAALLGRGLDRVLGDLAEIGFDAEWHCIPASAVGAPHRRDRLWLVAYPNGGRQRQRDAAKRPVSEFDAGRDVADAKNTKTDNGGGGGEGDGPHGRECNWRFAGGGSYVADTASERLEGAKQQRFGKSISERLGDDGQAISNSDSQPTQRLTISWGECSHWLAEPDVGRVAHGVPARVDRLRSLGNSVVPQIPEIIGRAILAQGGGNEMD
jgi:DNA (cytosine-5)-methyltransferase 1